MTRRMLGAVTLAAATVFTGAAVSFWQPLFGAGTWGAGGNLVAWVLCGGLAFGWTWLLQHERHVQAVVQAAMHHRELYEQAQRQHKERTEQAERHHREQLDRLDAHAESIKAHVSAQNPGGRM